MHFSQKSFGMVHDREIDLYAIVNDNGVVVTLTKTKYISVSYS